LSKPNEVDDKNGSCVVNGDSDSRLVFAVVELPVRLFRSKLSSSTMPYALNESNVGKLSNVAKIGVDGGTNGFVGLFNDDDNDDGSCLIIFVGLTVIAGVDFVDE